ncbi:MAG: hypothetical protein QM500_15295, partial [Methylococcales bacterium]
KKRLSKSIVGKAKMKLYPLKEEDFLIVGNNDSKRAPFGNHMYCEYNGNIFDACAGPVIGNGNLNRYIAENIDSTTTLNSLYGGLPGKSYDVKNYTSLSNGEILEVI